MVLRLQTAIEWIWHAGASRLRMLQKLQLQGLQMNCDQYEELTIYSSYNAV